MITADTQFTFTCDVCGYAEVTVFNGFRRLGADSSIETHRASIPGGWSASPFTMELTCASCRDRIEQAIADAETNARRALAASRKQAVT